MSNTESNNRVMLCIEKTRDLLDEAEKEEEQATLLLDRVSREYVAMKKLRMDTEKMVEEMTSNMAAEHLRIERMHDVVHAGLDLLGKKRAEVGALVHQRKPSVSEELTEEEVAAVPLEWFNSLDIDIVAPVSTPTLCCIDIEQSPAGLLLHAIPSSVDGQSTL